MLLTQCDFFAQCSECQSGENFQNKRGKKAGVTANLFEGSPALNVKVNEIQTSADPAVFWLKARHLCFLDGRSPQSGEIMGLLKLEDHVPAALANSLKEDEEDRRSDHAPLVAVTEIEVVAMLTATIETNLGQGRQICVAPSELWLRDDLEEVYALLFFLGCGFPLAMSNVGWLVTQKFVILVPDPIGFAPWSVLFGRGVPCDRC